MTSHWERLAEGGIYSVADFEQAAYALMVQQGLYASDNRQRTSYHLIRTHLTAFRQLFTSQFIPGGTKEQYEEVNRRAFGDPKGPSEPPPGLIFHTSGDANGTWRIFDVWESAEAYQQFMEGTIMPATEGMDLPEIQPEVYELHNTTGAATTSCHGIATPSCSHSAP